MATEKGAIRYITQMTKVDFHNKIIRGVAKSMEFSCLASSGEASAEDKAKICEALHHAGVPICYEETANFDQQLEEIVHAITARAVSVS